MQPTGKWSVPIFVMISGALFLGRDTHSSGTILQKNVLRIGWRIRFLVCAATHSSASLLRRSPLCRLSFTQFITGHYHLWFLYMIVGLYLLIPLLRPIVQNETLTRYFLLLALVFTFLLPQLALFCLCLPRRWYSDGHHHR
ncbi:MAG: acyltransferase family protein [Oscillospiraceae bacterium]